VHVEFELFFTLTVNTMPRTKTTGCTAEQLAQAPIKALQRAISAKRASSKGNASSREKRPATPHALFFGDFAKRYAGKKMTNADRSAALKNEWGTASEVAKWEAEAAKGGWVRAAAKRPASGKARAKKMTPEQRRTSRRRSRREEGSTTTWLDSSDRDERWEGSTKTLREKYEREDKRAANADKKQQREFRLIGERKRTGSAKSKPKPKAKRGKTQQ
jgi:hypothetical protein